MPDPFGRAIREFHEGEQVEPLVQRDGEVTLDHPIEEFYFGDASGDAAELLEHLDGPVLDLGCGAGRHALALQERVETVAVDVSEHLVAVARDRGVDDARVADMFALREAFPADRFRGVLSHGTQIGLAGSMDGLRAFLVDLAHVTTGDARAAVDGYDPDHPAAAELLGYRADPARGLAHRVLQFEYEGELGEPLCFRLFSPERLREAAAPTPWRVARVEPDEEGSHYRAILAKG